MREPAITPVTAIGSASGYVFLPSETDRASPAFAGFDTYRCFIDEFHWLPDLLSLRLITTLR